MTPKQNIRQRSVWKMMIVLFGLSIAWLWPAAANAGGCDSWYMPCGEVQNSSRWTMYVTTSLGAGPHYCDVWNSEGGWTWIWKKMRCVQEPLGAGGHRGGGTVDVDAFTFNDRDYLLYFKGLRVLRTKGVWTKISNYEGATCKNYSSSTPVCYVYAEP
jgi:hypothetical protein